MVYGGVNFHTFFAISSTILPKMLILLTPKIFATYLKKKKHLKINSIFQVTPYVLYFTYLQQHYLLQRLMCRLTFYHQMVQRDLSDCPAGFVEVVRGVQMGADVFRRHELVSRVPRVIGRHTEAAHLLRIGESGLEIPRDAGLA